MITPEVMQQAILQWYTARDIARQPCDSCTTGAITPCYCTEVQVDLKQAESRLASIASDIIQCTANNVVNQHL